MPNASVRILVGNQRFHLGDDPTGTAPKKFDKTRYVFCVPMHWKGRHFFWFPGRQELEDQLETCISIVHPMLEGVLGVRSVHLYPFDGRPLNFLSFRLGKTENRRLIVVQIKSFGKPIADVEFFLRSPPAR